MYSYSISHLPHSPYFTLSLTLILEAFIFHIIAFLNSNLLILSWALTADHWNTALES